MILNFLYLTKTIYIPAMDNIFSMLPSSSRPEMSEVEISSWNTNYKYFLDVLSMIVHAQTMVFYLLFP